MFLTYLYSFCRNFCPILRKLRIGAPRRLWNFQYSLILPDSPVRSAQIHGDAEIENTRVISIINSATVSNRT